MKRSVLMALLLALAIPCLAFGQAQTVQPPKPGPEVQKLEAWVGDWTYTNEAKATPLGPAGTISGKNSTRWVLGGFFIEFRGEEKGPAGTTQWFETDGYDPVTKQYTWKNYASDGAVQTVTYTIEGTLMRFSGTHAVGGKEYKIRGTFLFAPDLMSNTGKTETSVDGRTWMPWWESKATKTK